MKLAFVWPWSRAKEFKPLVKDGLMKAIEMLGEVHQVDWYLGDEEPPDDYDWIMVWGVSSVPFNYKIQNYKAKKLLFCAGHPDDTINLRKFNLVMVESPLIFEQLKPHCHKIILAFGTDTDFFKPLSIPKYIDAVYPATFSKWKRQDLFAEALGSRGLCFGVIQPDGVELFDYCQQKQCSALGGLMPSCVMPVMYNMARVCVITSWHGSERTVIEAMACNIPVVVTKDNELACSLLNGEGIIADPSPESIREAFEKAVNKPVNTREYILKNYSHDIYFSKILKEVEYD